MLSAVGFSNGCAEFALKNPPPFVPTSLIASWNATGPSAIVCLAPSSVVASTLASSVCGTPIASSATATTRLSGSRMYSIARVTSAQALPSDFSPPAAKARLTAHAAAIPVAAERKLCTVSPSICAPWLSVVSPA